jgi:hypothetical protein
MHVVYCRVDSLYNTMISQAAQMPALTPLPMIDHLPLIPTSTTCCCVSCRPLAVAAIRRQLDAAERAYAVHAAQLTDELLEQQRKLNENRAQLSAQVGAVGGQDVVGTGTANSATLRVGAFWHGNYNYRAQLSA